MVYGDLTKQYEVPLSRMLHGILDDDIQWHPPSIGQYTPIFDHYWSDLITEFDFLPNCTRLLDRTYATGAACQQRTLTPPDTWSCPFGTCICSTCWDIDTLIVGFNILSVCDIITGLNIFTESDILPNIGFHRAFATGVACRQGTLTPPDTWSCPTLGLACVLMSRPISPELVLSPDFWISNTPRYFSFA